jgi:hypothetical protein
MGQEENYENGVAVGRQSAVGRIVQAPSFAPVLDLIEY